MAAGGAQKLSPVCALVADRTGSSLSAHQVTRLTELLRSKLDGRSEEVYARFLQTRDGVAELALLMSAISVHKTDLFRDEVQLSAFFEHVLEPMVLRGRPLHLWSAGCATGEEVATLLVLLSEAGAHPESTVTGTDISAQALQQASANSFHPDQITRVPAHLRDRYFRPRGGRYALIPEVFGRARFRVHNLMDQPYPMAPGNGPFDVVFCRNVLIYFTDNAFDRTVKWLSNQLVDDGVMVLSAAEPILRPQPLLSTFRSEQAFFYIRRKEGKPWWAADAELSVPMMPEQTPRRTSSGEYASLPAPAPPPPSVPARRATPVAVQISPQVVDDPFGQATELFRRVMDDAAQGEEEQITEKGLRNCLYLDQHFAQARYLLALILEQRGDKARALIEYRRAHAALAEGKSRQTGFFLNNERLQSACARALERLEK